MNDVPLRVAQSYVILLLSHHFSAECCLGFLVRRLSTTAESGLETRAWPEPLYALLYRLGGSFLLLGFLLFLSLLTGRQLL